MWEGEYPAFHLLRTKYSSLADPGEEGVTKRGSVNSMALVSFSSVTQLA